MENNSNKIADINNQPRINEPYIKLDMSEIPPSAKTGLTDPKDNKENNGNEEVAGCLCCVAFCEIIIVCISGCGGGL